MIGRRSSGFFVLVAALSCAHGSQPRTQCPDPTQPLDRLQTEHGVLAFSAVRNRVTALALLPEKQAPLKMLVLPSFEPEQAVYLSPARKPNDAVRGEQGVPAPPQPEPDEYVAVASQADSKTNDRYAALLGERKSSRVPETERDDLWRRALKVQSRSAPISKSTVNALAAVWEKALLGARPAQRIDRECMTEIRVAGTVHVFANDYLDGVAPEIPGPRIQKLIALGEALSQYVRAAPADRAAIETKLQEEAAMLEREIDEDT